MDILRKKVESLYDYRDNFFNVHDISEALNKSALLKKELEDVLTYFENADESIKSKAEYFLLKGKAYNVGVEYDEQAEEFLSKAVKLDPKLTEAWTCLGDSYCKQDNFQAAKDCFISALSHNKDKHALRNLSTITRALGQDNQGVKDSLQMAKEALQMDFNDGASWLTLGNAYLAQYFANLQNSTFMKQALSAYSKAEQNSTTRHNYTLFYNKASALEYLENFPEAISSYKSVIQLNPTFTEAQVKKDSLMKYLHDVTTLVSNKGKIREKKLKSLVEKIKPSVDVGTFAPVFTKDSTECFKNIKQLSHGFNPKCLLVGRVVGSVYSEGRICQTFCLIDQEFMCTAVMVYNTSSKWGVCIGDAIVINEPTFKEVSMDSENNPIFFPAIRIDFPTHLLINGKLPTRNTIAPASLTQKIDSE